MQVIFKTADGLYCWDNIDGALSRHTAIQRPVVKHQVSYAAPQPTPTVGARSYMWRGAMWGRKQDVRVYEEVV